MLAPGVAATLIAATFASAPACSTGQPTLMLSPALMPLAAPCAPPRRPQFASLPTSFRAPWLVVPPPPVDPPADTALLRSLPVMTVGLIGVQVGTLTVLAQLPNSTTNWGPGSFDRIIENDLAGPKWDTDHWLWNYVSHPYVGSEYYLLARNRESAWWQSFLYATAMSTFWEMFTEAYYERPSQQDLVVTPVLGSVLGELRYQARRGLLRHGARTTWRKVLIVVLDPIEAITAP